MSITMRSPYSGLEANYNTLDEVFATCNTNRLRGKNYNYSYLTVTNYFLGEVELNWEPPSAPDDLAIEYYIVWFCGKSLDSNTSFLTTQNTSPLQFVRAPPMVVDVQNIYDLTNIRIFAVFSNGEIAAATYLDSESLLFPHRALLGAPTINAFPSDWEPFNPNSQSFAEYSSLINRLSYDAPYTSKLVGEFSSDACTNYSGLTRNKWDTKFSPPPDRFWFWSLSIYSTIFMYYLLCVF